MRNWMDVKLKELPMGSKLIMGLNPPFGVHGKDANMFVKKALEFQPKLLILIVPPDTERYLSSNPSLPPTFLFPFSRQMMFPYILNKTSLLFCLSHSSLFCRLDNNQPPYDLVWEDKNFLLGKKSDSLFCTFPLVVLSPRTT
ncbi:protein ENHANCED DOWNY MILDEW 2-like isoform X1 [Neltuma alba]|uniref:protein ENHANCED DOWNY MILDEW 2-like isoform X1 n=1 Tax=Neltuma alba TaxID=207710 RepID=UPI0010A34E2E|nr:protein ENHANCED DOWNY MILDEW 2-like isoform X1 [Prosopis alba]